jgi:hypothetical protein
MWDSNIKMDVKQTNRKVGDQILLSMERCFQCWNESLCCIEGGEFRNHLNTFYNMWRCCPIFSTSSLCVCVCVCVCEWVIRWLCECMSEWVSVWVWVCSAWMREFVSACVLEWVCEWVNECVCVCESECESECVCARVCASVRVRVREWVCVLGVSVCVDGVLRFVWCRAVRTG